MAASRHLFIHTGSKPFYTYSVYSFRPLHTTASPCTSPSNSGPSIYIERWHFHLGVSARTHSSVVLGLDNRLLKHNKNSKLMTAKLPAAPRGPIGLGLSLSEFPTPDVPNGCAGVPVEIPPTVGLLHFPWKFSLNRI